MLKKKYFLIALAILLIFAFAYWHKSFGARAIKISAPLETADNCYTKSIKIVRGYSMEPLVKAGTELILLAGYYNCHIIRRGDIVAYDYQGNINPLIKRVMVIGGDKLEWQNNNLIVNGHILSNSQGQPYGFTAQEKKMISLYIKNNELVPKAYLLFGEETSGSLDSRRFGAVSKRGILGKFEINKNNNNIKK